MSEDSAPRIGDPSTEHRPVCEYSLTRTSPQCDEQATVHLLITGTSGNVTLATCDEHLPIARAVGYVFGEHPHDPGICGMPGTVWRWQDVLSWCDLAIDGYDGVDRVLGTGGET